MKNTKYILLIILSFTLVNISKAQKSKPINSGFVFIDGKYIEPPYVVKIIDDKLLINKQILKSIKKPINPPKRVIVDKFPGYPPDSLNQEETMSYKNPKTENFFFADVVTYYVNKYGIEEARNLFTEYYCGLPNINCIQTEPYIEVKVENYSKPIIIAWEHFYIENQNQKSKKELKEQFKKTKYFELKTISEILRNGGCVFSINKEALKSIMGTKRTSKEFITKGIPIINNNKLNDIDKLNTLKNDFGFFDLDSIMLKFIEKGIDTTYLNKRIQ